MRGYEDNFIYFRPMDLSAERGDLRETFVFSDEC